jgi:hypothetical protein
MPSTAPTQTASTTRWLSPFFTRSTTCGACLRNLAECNTDVRWSFRGIFMTVELAPRRWFDTIGLHARLLSASPRLLPSHACRCVQGSRHHDSGLNRPARPTRCHAHTGRLPGVAARVRALLDQLLPQWRERRILQVRPSPCSRTVPQELAEREAWHRQLLGCVMTVCARNSDLDYVLSHGARGSCTALYTLHCVQYFMVQRTAHMRSSSCRKTPDGYAYPIDVPWGNMGSSWSALCMAGIYQSLGVEDDLSDTLKDVRCFLQGAPHATLRSAPLANLRAACMEN